MGREKVATTTLRSHGLKVLKSHMWDWLVLILLILIEVGLNVISPYYRFVGKKLMEELKYPMKTNTVPVMVVPVYAFLLPVVIFFIYYIRRRNVYDLHNAILGLAFALIITGVLTDAIKDAAGRARPNFFVRCFKDKIEKYDPLGNAICNGNAAEIKEGHKSFPSGHTSWSFAGLGFLSLYLAGKLQAFNGKGHVAKLCIVILPLLGAALVAVSRVSDYWHHWQDVTVGFLLGTIVTVIVYKQFYPAPQDPKGWGPYEYFAAVEEEQLLPKPSTSTSDSRPANAGPENSNNKHDIELGKV